MKIFAANWKLNKTPSETRDFLKKLTSELSQVEQQQVIIFPSSSCWQSASESLQNSKISWGGQNIWSQASGAFTGESSVLSLKELNATFALVGHSERRQLMGETNELVSQKIKIIQDVQLNPLICIGETLAEREAGITEKVLALQLHEGLKQAHLNNKIIIAYEPVWAIGTGRVATEEQIEAAHVFIKKELSLIGAMQTNILYGGSVKSDNAKKIGQIQNVDGFLIGGASLELNSFLQIIRA